MALWSDVGKATFRVAGCVLRVTSISLEVRRWTFDVERSVILLTPDFFLLKIGKCPYYFYCTRKLLTAPKSQQMDAP